MMLTGGGGLERGLQAISLCELTDVQYPALSEACNCGPTIEAVVRLDLQKHIDVDYRFPVMLQ